MTLTDVDYNGFARSLVERVAQRARGLDEESQRLVGVRPSDHILVGFLTPGGTQSEATNEADSTRVAERSDGSVENRAEELLAEDLPQDSAYEQTGVGMEWMAPVDALVDGSEILVDIDLAVYVRRLPSFGEQTQRATWRVPRRRRSEAAAGPAGTPEVREADLVPVWTREVLPRKRVRVSLGELRRKRRLSIELSGWLREEGWATVDPTGLYPGRRPISLSEDDVADQEAYDHWLASLPGEPVPFSCRPIVDVRLVAAPTEPSCVRVALRLINRSERPRPHQREYNDPNLYAVRVAAALPSETHRDTMFRELPESYRYDRRMPGVGINAHVISKRPDPTTVVLEADTVPTKEVPRLEPRSLNAWCEL